MRASAAAPRGASPAVPAPAVPLQAVKDAKQAFLVLLFLPWVVLLLLLLLTATR